MSHSLTGNWDLLGPKWELFLQFWDNIIIYGKCNFQHAAVDRDRITEIPFPNKLFIFYIT